MSPADRRLWVDLVAARYLAAVEDGRDRDAAYCRVLAVADPDLAEALADTDAGLAAERHERGPG